ncbi:hypothetical protein LB504_008235 [Fusarium proliferatum]|nr:hypothetical protein LB504_008235 [Fusarium proliferatum]
MKVTIKKWNTVATWRWDIPEDDVCGICQVHFDGTCPTCKYPGDDCSLSLHIGMDQTGFIERAVPHVSSTYSPQPFHFQPNQADVCFQASSGMNN